MDDDYHVVVGMGGSLDKLVAVVPGVEVVTVASVSFNCDVSLTCVGSDENYRCVCLGSSRGSSRCLVSSAGNDSRPVLCGLLLDGIEGADEVLEQTCQNLQGINSLMEV